MNARHWLAACTAVLASSITHVIPAAAQAWPDKPIKFVMSAPAGSSIDVLGRTIADKLKDRLGQPVVVENKAAAGGTVAVDEIAKAAPDGYAMAIGYNGPLAITPLLRKVPYNVATDFAPVIITSSQPNVLAVNAELPIRNVQELVAYAKANPGKVNYASVGNGSSSHLNAELLKSMAGIDLTHVPFNGSPPAVLSTVQGDTQVIFAVMQPLLPQIKAGKLRAIAVTSGKRFALLPDLPTVAESGYPAFESLAWNGVVVPAGTPAPVIARLNTEINAILKLPEIVQKMNASGFDLIGGTPQDFGALMKAEAAKWAPVIKASGIKIE